MKWLARVKTPPVAEMDATKPTKPIQVDCEGGFVGFVAPAMALIEKTAVVPDAKVSASLATDLDPRVTCTACRHLWHGNSCLNHHRAALSCRELAADFTQLRQHCDGFAPLARYSPSVSR